jgi:copper(I)-binding protein
MADSVRSCAGAAARARVIGAAICLVAAPAFALAAGPADVLVSHAWVRATVPGQPAAAAYMDITSTRGGTVTQIGSDAAGVVQMHSMWMEGDVMRMRQLSQLPLPKDQTVHLAPSGKHLMLLDLKRPLRAGETVRFELTVVDADAHRQLVRTVAKVRQTGAEQ